MAGGVAAPGVDGATLPGAIVLAFWRPSVFFICPGAAADLPGLDGRPGAIGDRLGPTFRPAPRPGDVDGRLPR